MLLHVLLTNAAYENYCTYYLRCVGKYQNKTAITQIKDLKTKRNSILTIRLQF